MTHYETLGVPPDATPEQINKAYRQAARGCHPDHHEGAEAAAMFKRVSAAYEVLSDADRRAHYDRTGQNEQPDLKAEATAALATTFFAMMDELSQAQRDPEKYDIMTGMTGMLTLSIRKHEGTIRDAEKHVKQAEAIAARFVVKGGGDNLLAGMARSGVRDAQAAMAQARHYLAVLDAAKAMLKDYVYNYDKKPDGRIINEPRMFTMGPFSGTGNW